MISWGISLVLILSSIQVVSATMITEDLHCCSPELGVFKTKPKAFMFNYTTNCWNEKTNKSNPLRLTCPKFHIFKEEVLNLEITDTGLVFLRSRVSGEVQEIKHGEVCFANYTNSDEDTITRLVAICAGEQEGTWRKTVLGFCMSVSAVFLLLTAVIYAALPEVRDLQGKIIINFCGSMGIGLSTLSASILIPYSDMTLCAIRGFIIYFFMMASFFWSNAISVQMLLSIRRPVVSYFGWKEICWYALYAWGCPAVLTLCMAVVNFYPGDHKKPGIGLNTCWFFNMKQQWYYMYSVMSILIIANICIFIYTSVHLWRLSFSSSHVKALRYKFVMSVRMFIIMGISWIFEMISSLTEKHVLWHIIDVFNSLQGPLIFLLLVVFRRRVVKALLTRGCLFCLAGPVERYLALKEDDEEGVIWSTVNDINEMTGVEKNGT